MSLWHKPRFRAQKAQTWLNCAQNRRTSGEVMDVEIAPIAHIRTDFPTKFGLPRQSGLVEELRGVVEFEPEYR